MFYMNMLCMLIKNSRDNSLMQQVYAKYGAFYEVIIFFIDDLLSYYTEPHIAIILNGYAIQIGFACWQMVAYFYTYWFITITWEIYFSFYYRGLFYCIKSVT